MGFGLYDAAFAALGRIFGATARGPITGITLIAGFASTVGWPLTAWGEAELGWRMTCAGWALAHLLIGLPLNLLVPKIRTAAVDLADAVKPRIRMDRAMLLLSFAFAAGWVVSTAMAAHLPRVLEAAGASAGQAVAAAALVGPAQVAARMIEAAFLARYHPLISARLSTVVHPLGAGLLILGGGWLAMPFTLLHGAGNGILTIARGTLPLALFGPEGFGRRVGLLSLPARATGAIAPLAIGLMTEHFGTGALWFSAIVSLSAFAALMLLKSGRRPSP
jgi:hypothetical protein